MCNIVRMLLHTGYKMSWFRFTEFLFIVIVFNGFFSIHLCGHTITRLFANVMVFISSNFTIPNLILWFFIYFYFVIPSLADMLVFSIFRARAKHIGMLVVKFGIGSNLKIHK